MSVCFRKIETDIRERFNTRSLRSLTENLSRDKCIRIRDRESTFLNARRSVEISDLLLSEIDIDRVQLHDLRQEVVSNYKKFRDVKIETCRSR